MKKIIQLIPLLLVILMAGTLVIPVSAAAPHQETQPGDPAQPPVSQNSLDVFMLKDLGFVDAQLIGPFASTAVDFSIPPDWVFTEQGTLWLKYSASVSYRGGASQVDAGQLRTENIFGGQLQVRMNDTLISTQALVNSGDQQVSIPIPPEAFASQREDGRSSLTFNLVSNESCYYDLDVILNISADTFMILPHDTGAPNINLARLPYPIYQRSPLQPSSAVMVIPDQPSPQELRAMIEVASGFGDLSSGNLVLTTLFASELTPEILANNHLVFVGKPSAFPQLALAKLPVPLSGSAFDPASGVQPDDGVLQMAVSPWNSAHTILLVSGSTDLGVVKAGHVLNVGQIFTIQSQDFAIIQEIDPGMRMMVSDFDMRFSDLGIQDRTVRGAMHSSGGYASTTVVEFFVPNDQQIGLDSYLELHYNHSELIDFSNSGISILLNGRPVGSIGFTEDDVNYSTARITLPRSVVLPGKNTISIQVSMYPIGICDSLYNQSEAFWTTLYADSILHVALEALPIPPARLLDLKLFPDLMLLNPNTGDLAFIVDPSEPASIKAASAIAFLLGDFNNILTNKASVHYAGQVTPEELAGKDVILLGIPNSLTQKVDWTQSMPVPFVPGTNSIASLNAEVIYRIPENAEIGYLQLFAAPWDNKQVVLSVLGTSSQSLLNAGNAYGDDVIEPALVGNFAILSGAQVIALDTRLSTDISGVLEGTPIEVEVSPEEIAEQTGSPAADSGNSFAGRLPENRWILPLLVVSTGIAALIVLGVIVSSLRSRGRKRPIIVEVEDD
ncbi:MAG: cellulose biosynthesis cyclic di-GMP-binding regulatory protein BcsB [Chloroflexi bacterium]|nr:cellulose biosynthesis cyclic di-GMP-binding regulatory protein BcsB [Chloroflexota bacterium]